MKKISFLSLAIIFLITACSGSTPTPISLFPTPTTDYQVVGKTSNVFMVVVDPKDRADRAGLQNVGDYLCTQRFTICIVWFWDDINNAATTYPVDPARQQTAIALYTHDGQSYKSTLVVYTLGDK